MAGFFLVSLAFFMQTSLDPLFNSAQTVMPESEIFIELFGNSCELSQTPTHHKWEFEECQITNTNTLPIVPTTSWVPLEYPNIQTPQTHVKNQFAQQLLASWDVRIEEFIMANCTCEQTFSNIF